MSYVTANKVCQNLTKLCNFKHNNLTILMFKNANNKTKHLLNSLFSRTTWESRHQKG